MAGLFHFKQFSVDQSGCAMKINTDGVLLGALIEANQPKRIFDIGTGTGVIALMLAQRFTVANIEAVEIDEAAAKTAEANFESSVFSDRLSLFANSFERFFEGNPDKKFDLIVSNPPFYINSLQSPGAGKKLAKHTNVDFFGALISGVAKHLTNEGLFWLILSIDTAELVKQLAVANRLYLQQIISVKSYPESEPHREMMSFALHQTKMGEREFVIYDAPKAYSGQYQAALRDFFTIFP
jgi:tRNA1Val (adenine37-N6)-methyltransferase